MGNKGPRKIGPPKTGVAWVEHPPAFDLGQYFPAFNGLEDEQRKDLQRRVSSLVSIYHTNASFANTSRVKGASWNSLLSQAVGPETPILQQIDYARKRIKSEDVKDVVAETREIDSFNFTVKEIHRTLVEAGFHPVLSHTRVVQRKDTKPSEFEKLICDQLRDGGYSPASLKSVYNALKIID